ncbi:MAG TPA: methyltransferase domain-containing protein, partial [Patescibacteria group bacterium]|nr:methyltransferase domain-containing protein [Patescibacteria group bacterium]
KDSSVRNVQRTTSWQPISSWYTKSVGESGNYYHQHVVIPAALRLLNLNAGDSLLDLACGQGVLERQIPASVHYVGLDIAPSLIMFATEHARNKDHRFAEADVTKPLPLQKHDFTHASLILSLQNIEKPELALKTAADHLQKNGTFVIIMNHPCFRIPRQSSWGIDERNKTQYRRIDRYISPMKIPITAAPSREQRSQVTWSFHFPLSTYSQFLQEAGFVIERIEELGSDKVSVGKAASMENRSRAEFPLFLAISARKEV